MSDEREPTYRVVGVWGDGNRLILFHGLSELDARLKRGLALTDRTFLHVLIEVEDSENSTKDVRS